MTDRPRLDDLTDDKLDQLYADLDWAREQILTAQQETTDAVTRAEKAEAELGLTVGVIQTLRRQLDDTEAAVQRVRDWATRTKHGTAAAEVLRALDGTT